MSSQRLRYTQDVSSVSTSITHVSAVRIKFNSPGQTSQVNFNTYTTNGLFLPRLKITSASTLLLFFFF